MSRRQPKRPQAFYPKQPSATATDLGHVTTFGYDVEDKLTSVTTPDPDGAGAVTASTTAYEYDIYDRLKKITDALGGLTLFTYDKADQMLTLIDPESNTTTWAYDSLGRVTMETNQLSDTRSFYHDAAGNLTRKVDRNERVTQYVYDDLNRMIEEHWIDSGTPVPTIAIATTTQGGGINEVQRVGFTTTGTGFAGGTFTLTFGGQTTAGIAYNASAATVQAALEALSNIAPGDVSVTKTQDTTQAHVWQITFTGSLAATNHGQTTINSSGVSAMGPKTDVQTTDVQGQATTTDEVQTVTLSNATDGTFRLAFGGQVTAPIAYNASAGTVETALEALQAVDQVTVTGSAGGPWTITFAGTHADTNVAALQGDAATAESGSVARTISKTYDAANQLTAASDPDSAYAYTYDNLGRMLTVSNSGTPTLPTVVLTNTYDSRSNRTSLAATINSTADFKNDYTYDDLGQLTRVEQNGQTGGNTVRSKRADIAYNGLGQITQLKRETKPSGSWVEVATSLYGYDDDNRLISLDHQRAGTNLFTGYDWTYDPMNRVTQVTSADGTTTYAYDKRTRLTSADHSYQSDESFSYDGMGNRTMSGYVVGDDNRLLSDGTYDYEYDDEGNLTKRTTISDDSYVEYQWDHRNRLTQVKEKDSGGTLLAQADYTYDVFNRRIRQVVDGDGAGGGAAVDTFWAYDGDKIVLGFDDNAALDHRYLSAPSVDAVLADENALNDVLTPLTDNLGTVHHLVNSTGTVQNQIQYGAYGNVTSQTNSSVTFYYGFAGMQSSAGMLGGVVSVLHNYYNPSIGAFVSQTPQSPLYGASSSYSYGLSSPSNFVQPSGTFPQPGNPYAPSYATSGPAYAQWYWAMMQQQQAQWQQYLASNPPSSTPYTSRGNPLMAGGWRGNNLDVWHDSQQGAVADEVATAVQDVPEAIEIGISMVPGIGEAMDAMEVTLGADIHGNPLTAHQQVQAGRRLMISMMAMGSPTADLQGAMQRMQRAAGRHRPAVRTGASTGFITEVEYRRLGIHSVGHSGGRRGSPAVRDFNDLVRDWFQSLFPEADHTGGARNAVTGDDIPETYIPPRSGGRRGGSYADLTFTFPGGWRVHINTADVYAGGLPTIREWRNGFRLVFNSGEPLVIIGKP